jgi:hypothetical protein
MGGRERALQSLDLRAIDVEAVVGPAPPEDVAERERDPALATADLEDVAVGTERCP